MKSNSKEGLQLLRLIMVLSSMAPLFILWAIRGSGPINDWYFVPVCLFFAIEPTLILIQRIQTAQKNSDIQTKTVHKVDDHRDHILVYLFAMLLPFYSVNLANSREFSATVVALVFIVFLFWHLNMHYMNLIFAMTGYRVFTVTPDPESHYGGRTPFVILSRQVALAPGDQIDVYRLSNTVFIEK